MAVLVALAVSVGFLSALFQIPLGAPNPVAAVLAAMVAAAVWLCRPGAQFLLKLGLSPAAYPIRSVVVLVAATGALLVFTARVVLDGFPNSGDEYAAVLQAMTYAGGRLWVDAPPQPDHFLLYRFVAKDGIWISQYPPGWPLVLTPFAALHIPLWLANPILGGASVAAFYVLARHYVSSGTAWLATLSLSTCAFFVLNFGSFFSHGFCLLLAVLAALFARRYLDDGRWRDALMTGALVGLVGFTRPYNAAALILAVSLGFLLSPGRRAGLLPFAAAGLPFLLALLAYNELVTGDLLLFVPEWFYGSRESISLPTLESGATSAAGSQTTGLDHVLWRLKALLVWTSPVLFVGWLAGMLLLGRERKLDLTDWIAPATIVLLLFYPGSGGNQYGPRYYFEALPFVLLTAAKLADRHLLASSAKSSLIAAAILAHFAYQAGFAIPRLALEHRVVMERQEVYRLVEQAELSEAVVFIQSPTSPTRVMYPMDLVRNGLVVGDESVTYALDLGERNAELRALFPDRKFYLYSRGRLTPLN